MSEKKVRNVLITSIIGTDSRKNIGYFYYKDGDTRKIGSCIARSEAAVYRLLSMIHLNEIIAVGSKDDINENDLTGAGVLTDNIDYMKADTDKLSDYSFFRYRLCQFIDEIDLETLDINDAVPAGRQKELEKAIKKILGEDLSRGFIQVLDEYKLLRDIYKEGRVTEAAEKDWIKRCLYCNIRDINHIAPAEQNKNIKISFLQVVSDQKDADMLSNIDKLMEILSPGENEVINIYVDIQALSLMDAYVFLNYLKTLDIDTKNGIFLRDVLSLNYKKNTLAQRLDDASSRFKVSEFTSGIDLFINYGKADMLKQYWRKTGEENSYIDELLYAMSKIDTGINLCNNNEIIEGIKMFIASMNKLDDIKDVDFNSEAVSFIYQVRNSVMRDYAGIMDEDGSLNLLKLIKWEYEKGFYQQVMTMIESKTPDILRQTGLLYFAENEEEKNKFLEFVNKLYWKEDGRFRYAYKNPGHWVIKNLPHSLTDPKVRTDPYNLKFAQALIDCLEPDNKSGLQLHSLTEDKKGLTDLLVEYYDMGGMRNKINHANMRNGQEEEIDFTKDDPVIRELSNSIRKFIGNLENLVEGVKGKTFTSLDITYEEANSYYWDHKIFEDRGNNSHYGNSGDRKESYDKGRSYDKDRWNRNNKGQGSDNGSSGQKFSIKDNSGREIHIHIHID